MGSARYRIGIDVGGTFTDFVLVDMDRQLLSFHKEPSVPDDPSAAVERGLEALERRTGLMPTDVEVIVHGTTIGLNAIIQRRGARMALVVSEGNRDVLEIARLRLPSSYDFTVPRERPLVPRDRVFEIDARMRADGTIVSPPSAERLASLGEALAGCGVEAVAVMLLNAYRDAGLERTVAAALRAALPTVLVTESGVIWPEVREYERCVVTALNAFIHPLMTRYFNRLQANIANRGIQAPIYITGNNGGTLGLDTARARPINTILSGPASGVVASTRIGAAVDQPRLITLDMGGTSADMALCRAGVPEFATGTFVGEFPLMMPVVNVGAIGAGGGSILWVDAQGVLKIGPDSAGADPGPVCYRRGGTRATITDCYLACGILHPDRFLGGRMRLDADGAHGALDRIADRLGLDGVDRSVRVAEAALRVASTKMATEVIKLTAQAGIDPRDFSLVAYGGAGPTHANLLVLEARLNSVLVPTAPGTFCALGAVLADVRRDYVRTARHLIAPAGVLDSGQDGWPSVALALADLESEARAWIAREGDLIGEHDITVSFNLRYPSQAYELEVIVPPDQMPALSADLVCALFHTQHHQLYGFQHPTSPVQTTTLRLAVIGRVPAIGLPELAPGEPNAQETRQVWLDGRWTKAAVYARSDLGHGAMIDGPAVVEQPDTTVLLLPGWRARADRHGTLHMTEVPLA